MIYVSRLAIQPEEEIHLYLRGMVSVIGSNHDASPIYGPDGMALCGYEGDENVHPGGLTPYDGLVDLLNNANVCEDCKTRAAVYFDVDDEVDLWATWAHPTYCDECNREMDAEILGVTRGHFKRKHTCPEDGMTKRDVVALPEDAHGED